MKYNLQNLADSLPRGRSVLTHAKAECMGRGCRVGRAYSIGPEESEQRVVGEWPRDAGPQISHVVRKVVCVGLTQTSSRFSPLILSISVSSICECSGLFCARPQITFLPWKSCLQAAPTPSHPHTPLPRHSVVLPFPKPADGQGWPVPACGFPLSPHFFKTE